MRTTPILTWLTLALLGAGCSTRPTEVPSSPAATGSGGTVPAAAPAASPASGGNAAPSGTVTPPSSAANDPSATSTPGAVAPAGPVAAPSMTAGVYDPVWSGVPAADIPCQGGWCWANFPRGGDIRAGWATARDDVWLVGGQGTTLHYDGEAWTAHWAGDHDLEAVWASSGGETWALDRLGAMLRWDGTRWSAPAAAAPCPYAGLSASGDTAWCFAGPSLDWPSNPALARFDGRTWTTITVPKDLLEARDRPRGVWAAAPDDVFAAVDSGVLRYRAGSWTEKTLPGAYAISGSAPDDVWVAAGTPLTSGVWHFDGAGWSEVDELHGQWIWKLLVAARGDVWATGFDGLGYHLAGGTWTRVPHSPEQVWCAAGTGQVWGSRIGYGSALLRWDGSAWTPVAHLSGDVRVFSADASGAAWALAATEDVGVELVRWDGRSFSVVPSSRLPIVGFVDVEAITDPVSGSGDVRLQYDADCFRWDGSTWTMTTEACATEAPTAPPQDAGVATWSPRPGVWFAAGFLTIPYSQSQALTNPPWSGEHQDLISRWDGSAWQPELLGPKVPYFDGSMYRIDVQGTMWGAAADDGWAILEAAYHYDGRSWTRVDAGPSHAVCLWGTSTSEVWAAKYYQGYPHSAWHWDGTRWSDVAMLTYFSCGTGAWARATGGSVWHRP